jgi:hypothetical protein
MRSYVAFRHSYLHSVVSLFPRRSCTRLWRRFGRAHTFAASTGSVQAFVPVADAVVAARAATTFAQATCALASLLRRWIVTQLIMTNTLEIAAAQTDFLVILLLLSEHCIRERLSMVASYIIYVLVANMAALRNLKCYLYIKRNR